jgi:cation diffusion facilitator CzcD-associated flavoprotein CzcO
VRSGIVIVGAGFSGIGMAIGLKKAGYHDFVVLEKGDDLGGTWRDNRYPGCACDVPSPLYSYSFELNPAWTRLFAPRQEIWDYLRGCARKYGVDGHIRYGCAVSQMNWDEQAQCWHVATTSHGPYQARAVVAAAGALHLPSCPDIPGRGEFGGTAFHSARWDHTVSLKGRQVAVIGTGASAIQFIPEIASQPDRLRVFQRTAPWVQPRPDAAIPARMRGTLTAAPLAARAMRDAIYWTMEAAALGFAVHPALMAPVQARAQRHLARQVTDPGLRARLTPDYTIGCKRILLSSRYYPALQRPNVDLITDRITMITPAGLITADGTAHPADVIIYATGFKVIEAAAALNVTGRDGRKLADEGLAAYRGITVPGFPNFFMMLGPNTALGHTSVVFMIESQVQHILSCLRMLARDRAATIEAGPEATSRYTTGLQRRLRRAVWSAGGCVSWYLDEAGINRAIWPGFSFEYWARTRRARRRSYQVN